MTHLDISWNGVGTAGCAALGQAIGMNRTLVNLRLVQCNVYLKGALSLLKGFRQNATLEVLDVSQPSRIFLLQKEMKK